MLVSRCAGRSLALTNRRGSDLDSPIPDAKSDRHMH